MRGRELFTALVVSLLLHILICVAFYYLPELNLGEKTNALEAFLITPDGGWQIADIEEPKVQEKPEQSKFLGMYNQRAGEETVARSSSESGVQSSETRTKKSTDDYKLKTKTEDRKPDSEIAMQEPIKLERNEVSSGSPESGLSGIPEDYYPDYKYGDHTYINVLRYPDVEYFVRLKRIFKTTWNPVPALKADMQATSISRGMVSVVMAVSVDKKGELSELFILRSSGLNNYDHEAIRTVRASSPFSSPPDKFLEDGFLRMS